MLLESNFEREYRACACVTLIDRDGHLAREAGMCANQTLGNLPSGLRFVHTATHTHRQMLTHSKIVSFTDMLIKLLKHLFADNCLKGLLPVLHAGPVGVKVCKRMQHTALHLLTCLTSKVLLTHYMSCCYCPAVA